MVMDSNEKICLEILALFWLVMLGIFLRGISAMSELKKRGFKFPQHSDLE